MSRISHCVKGDVLLSLDQGSRPRLGTCQKFKIEKFVFEVHIKNINKVSVVSERGEGMRGRMDGWWVEGGWRDGSVQRAPESSLVS